jgi:quercetin dioxygenase-like cupin family protein
MKRSHRRLRFVVSGLVAMCSALAVWLPALAQQQRNQPDPGLDSSGAPLPGTSIPCAPIAEKRQELGCYVVARQRLGALPQGTPLAWQLDVFPNRAAAEAAKGQLATIAEVFDRIWLFTIAPPVWRPGPGVEHVATVGPLPLYSAPAEYTAMYLATTFRPGLSSFVHEHPGPEAWFIVSGEQCLETPDGPIWGRAGDGVVVRGDLPMVIHATGHDIRRNLTLVLHDAAKPATTPVDRWQPRGLCRK